MQICCAINYITYKVSWGHEPIKVFFVRIVTKIVRREQLLWINHMWQSVRNYFYSFLDIRRIIFVLLFDWTTILNWKMNFSCLIWSLAHIFCLVKVCIYVVVILFHLQFQTFKYSISLRQTTLKFPLGEHDNLPKM